MKYEIMDSKYTKNYTDCYLKAVENHREIDCFIWSESEYRMNAKESVITTLTDPDVLLEYCIYPLYINGDKEIGNRVKKIIYELIDDGKIIGVYQVVKFIYAQDKLLKRYEELPLIVDVKEVIPSVLSAVDKLSDEMKNFRKGEFALYPKSMYEMLQGMIRKSKSFN